MHALIQVFSLTATSFGKSPLHTLIQDIQSLGMTAMGASAGGRLEGRIRMTLEGVLEG